MSRKEWLLLTYGLAILGILLLTQIAQCQTSTITWGTEYQTIQGFGGSNAFASAPMSTANENFFFGTGSGQLGMSILRVEIPDANSGNAGEAGSCTTQNTACAGTTIADMQSVVSNGGIVVGSPWSPPAAYKSNGSVACTSSSNAYLLTADYANFATWLVNWVKSMQTYAGITPYGVSIQNEPDSCDSYSTAIWTGATLDSFIATAMEPAWSSAGITAVKIMMPEPGIWAQLDGSGTTFISPCNTDASCYPYIGVVNWHDYDAVISGTNTVAGAVLNGWTNGTPQYWETETSCPGAGSMGCTTPESATILDALNWGAVVDDRLVNANANAWMYWWLQSPTTDAQGLMDQNGSISPRAYMLGQYSKFIRPGSVRISATHNPVSTVTVSAYRPPTANTIAIVATNYNTSSQAVTFTLSGAPTFTSLTPVITSSTQNMATLSAVSLTSNSFTYTLPAQSIITFSGTASVTTTSVVVSSTLTSLYAGQVATLSCTQEPSGSPCTSPTYSETSGGATVTISGSTMTGKSFGTDTITATANGFTSAGLTINEIPPPQEPLGNIPVATILNGLGFNVTATNSWEFALAKSSGATSVRFQCGWNSTEIQSAPPANTGGTYTLANNCPNALSYAASNGLNVDIVAAYGPPYQKILSFTVPAGAASGATSLAITFSSGVGGSTLANIIPFFSMVANSGGGLITNQGSYAGGLITAVTESGTTGTITLASGLSAALPASTSTTYEIVQNLYRPAATWATSNASIIAYGNYVAYLAAQMHAAGVSGQVELWNEPPWTPDPWDNICGFYTTSPCPFSPGPQSAGIPDYGFVSYLQTTTPPSGVTYNWGGTEKSGTNSIVATTSVYGGGNGQMYLNTGVNLTEPQTVVTAESMHPYGNNPEDSLWSNPIMQTTTGSNDYYVPNLFGVGPNLSYAYQQSMLEKKINASYGLTDNITETNFSFYNSSDLTHYARWDVRQFLGYLAAGLTNVNFYRLWEASPDSDGLSLTNPTTEAPLQPLTALQGIMSDAGIIKYPPPVAYSAGTLTAVTTWGNSTGYPLDSMHVVGATSAAATKNSELMVLWQRTYTTSGNWYSLASPTASPVTVTMPTGQVIISATNLTSRAAVSYTQTGQAVTLNVADDPVELLIEPSGSSILSAPTFAPTSENFYPSVTVTLASPTGSVMCYTTNGTTPAATTAGTCSNGTQTSSNSGSVTITTSTNLQAIATEASFTNSSVTSATYTYTPPGTPDASMSGSSVLKGSGTVN